jgi:putative ABC transport system permease protein
MGVAQVPAAPDPVASGRWFTAEELQDGRRVAVISASLAELIEGDSLVLEGHRWDVIGVLPAQPGDTLLRITVPVSSAAGAMVPSEWPRAPTLLVKATDIAEVEAVRTRVERWLAAQNPAWPRGVTVTTNAARTRQTRQAVLVFKLAMGAITGISLIVGGIGIMNVLLASVAERTREIGIRKATGARHRDILGQFLAESVAITAAGSIVGVLLGLGGAFAITAIIRAQTRATMYAAFTWGTVAVAVVASVSVGLLFGMYPAMRAARLSPIDAIRHE